MDIYVACIPKLVTGGIELLHQLTAELNGYEGINAYIWFPDWFGAYIPEPYKEYGNTFAVTKKPDKGSVLVFPEVMVDRANSYDYKDYTKVLYFESVDWYLHWIPKNQYLVFPKDAIFLAQSYYAMEFVEKNTGIRPIYVTDYLNDEYMNADLSKPRKRQILYNPKKGLEVTKRIMAELPDEKFIPIEKMTTTQVKNLMEESMLYIDFGNHPGKDRIPREAAMCGCCVITNCQGSANYFEDVPIPFVYKFPDNFIHEVPKQIVLSLDNYDVLNSDFELYREMIKSEKKRFKHGVAELVDRLRGIKLFAERKNDAALDKRNGQK